MKLGVMTTGYKIIIQRQSMSGRIFGYSGMITDDWINTGEDKTKTLGQFLAHGIHEVDRAMKEEVR